MTSGRALTTLVILALGVTTPTWSQSVSPPPIDDLVRNLQAKYDSVRDFSADFEHRYSGGVLRTSIVEHGTVLVKKPGKMRWRYTSSEEKLYVSDGEIFYSFFPLDQQVVVTEVPPDDQASTSALFLAGKGSLADDFTAAYANEPEAPDSWIVRLTPETSGADYERLTLTVDRESLAITGLSTEDLQGGRSSYLFTNLVENRGVPDSAFDFEIPENADVIKQDAVAR